MNKLMLPLPASTNEMPVELSESKSTDWPSAQNLSSQPWLVNPVLDVLFCCGGVMWIVCAIQMAQSSLHFLKPVVLLLTAFGTYVLTSTHFGTTLIRAHDQNIARFSISSSRFSVCAVVLALCCSYQLVAEVICKIYLLAVIPHYCMQICSIAKMYMNKAQYMPGKLEQGLLQSVIWAAGGFLIVLQLTDPKLTASLLGLQLPFWGPLPGVCSILAALLLVAVSFGYALMVIKRSLTERKFVPLPVMLLVVAGISIFIPNQSFGDIIGFYAPAYFHGIQQIYVTLADKYPASNFMAQRDNFFLPSQWMEEKTQIYLTIAFLIGCMAVFGVPGLLTHLGSAQPKLVLPVVLTLFSFHHFYIDAKLWRKMAAK